MKRLAISALALAATLHGASASVAPDPSDSTILVANVSAPDHHHLAMATAAMKRGKHVYLQKPMAKTMQEAEFLRRTARECGVVTQMGTQFTAHKSERQVIDMIRSRKLGPVEHVYLFSTRRGGDSTMRPRTLS